MPPFQAYLHLNLKILCLYFLKFLSGFHQINTWNIKKYLLAKGLVLLLGCCCVGEGKQGVLWKCYTTKVCRVRYRLRELGREAADCYNVNPGAIKPSLLVEHLHSQCCLPEPNAYKYWLSGRILTKAGSSSRILTNTGSLGRILTNTGSPRWLSG